MKYLGCFFLLCGLLNAVAWGQSVRKNQGFVVLRCTGISCSASFVARTDNPEVKIGTFKSLLTVHSGIRPAKRDVKLGTFKSLTLIQGL
jgi:hypothetical protein